MTKITIKEIKEMINNHQYDELNKKIEWNFIVPIQEYSTMMAEANAMVFPNGIYNDYSYSFALKYVCLTHLTNIDTEGVNQNKQTSEEDSQFIAEQLSVLFELCQVYDVDVQIENHILTRSLKNDFENSIAFRKELIANSSSWDSVGDLVVDYLTKLNNLADADKSELFNLLRQIGSLTSAKQKDENKDTEVK